MTIMTPEPMGSELVISDKQSTFSPAQRAALAHMGVDKAPDADVQVFFHVCQRTKLDPFAKQIFMIGRKASELVDGSWQKVMKYTIQTGIDGLRLVARRVADAEGGELEYPETLWCGRDGVWRDVWLSEDPPAAAKATVVRNGKKFPHVAIYSEYVQTTQKNGVAVPNSMWSSMPANQLAKCAEAGALRKAYPQDLGGLYIDAEVNDRADAAAAEQVVSGGRDWRADADAATSVEQLAAIWSEAHRQHALNDRLREHIQSRKVQLQEAAAAADVQDAEVIDTKTGEVIQEPGVDAGEATDGGAPTPSRDTAKVKRATLTAILRELDRCGVDAAAADAYRPVLGMGEGRLADLPQDAGVELLDVLRGLTLDSLAALVADAAKGEPR